MKKVAAGLIVLGVAFTLLNVRLPILRNALVYAHTTVALEQHHAWQVCSDAAQVHAQGCGFSLMALPFARAFGLNVGLKLASCLATALWILAMIAFFRRFGREEDVALSLFVTCFNPLVMNQFWSAHADSLFAALFLLSFVYLDRALKDHSGYLGYTLSVMAAVFVRPAGLILYPLQFLYVLWYRDRITPRLWIAAAMLAAWAGLGKLGHNPLLNLNKGEYQVPVAYLSSVAQVVALAAITFGILLVVVAFQPRVTMQDVPLLIALVGYVHVIMVFHASTFNLRYYIPILPIAALFVVRSVEWRPALAAFAAINAALILAFDVSAANRVFMRVAPHRINWDEYGHFDNLRLAAQLRMKDVLARINAELPPGGELYYVSPYYDGVAQGIYQSSGLIRPDIRIHYLKARGEVPDGAWIFFPEKISRHPSDPPGEPLEVLAHGAAVVSLTE